MLFDSRPKLNVAIANTGESYPCALDESLLRGMLIDWWSQLYDSPASSVFKLVFTEVRNFPEIARYYADQVVEPANRLLGDVLRQGIARGEFRAVDVDHAVHSLVLPLVMICLHRDSLGACPGDWHLDGRAFIAQHVALVLDGLCLPPASAPPAPPPIPTRAACGRATPPPRP